MCIIIVKQRNIEIPKEVLKNSSRINPHGLGVVWLDTFEVSYHTSKQWKVLDTDRPFIAHFRYATVGKVGKSNTHPFRCGANSHEYLMMNGTIHGLGDKNKCDSKVLAESLDSVPRHKWKDTLEKNRLVRFITINVRTRTFQLYNRDLWTFKDGVWYSKDNVLQHNLVAVYGTLKKGNSNYYRYLTDSRHVGSGKTEDKYPMLVEGIPYLIEQKGVGHNVKVDLFKVSDTVLAKLDQLEGHPNWYCRKKIPIVTARGNVVNAWIYFNPTIRVSSFDTLHESFEQKPYRPHPFEPTASSTYKQLDFSSFDKFDNYPADIEEECDEEIVDTPYCTSCYRDLEHDGFGNYCCVGCNEWYTQNDVDNLL
jgi:gamma-glutamylaminecyclotransferase